MAKFGIGTLIGTNGTNEFNIKLKKCKNRHRNKLRRLNKGFNKQACSTKIKTLNYGFQDLFFRSKLYICSMLFTIVLSYFCIYLVHNSFCSKPNFMDELLNQYKTNYMAIVYNKVNYCQPNADLRDMFDEISKQVLNQNEALSNLRRAFRNQSATVQTIAIIGSSGVGKSMTARLLREYFPWPENVFWYSGDTYVHDSLHRYHDVCGMLQKLSSCGRNLMIIENLRPCDYEFIKTFNQIVHNRVFPLNIPDRCAAIKQYNLIVLFVINLNRLLPYGIYKKQYAQMQHLTNMTVINYNSFGRKQLEDCLRQELNFAQLTMNDKNFHDILTTINVSECGCKTIQSKMHIYVTSRT